MVDGKRGESDGKELFGKQCPLALIKFANLGKEALKCQQPQAQQKYTQKFRQLANGYGKSVVESSWSWRWGSVVSYSNKVDI